MSRKNERLFLKRYFLFYVSDLYILMLLYLIFFFIYCCYSIGICWTDFFCLVADVIGAVMSRDEWRKISVLESKIKSSSLPSDIVCTQDRQRQKEKKNLIIIFRWRTQSTLISPTFVKIGAASHKIHRNLSPNTNSISSITFARIRQVCSQIFMTNYTI